MSLSAVVQLAGAATQLVGAGMETTGAIQDANNSGPSQADVAKEALGLSTEEEPSQIGTIGGAVSSVGGIVSGVGGGMESVESMSTPETKAFGDFKKAAKADKATKLGGLDSSSETFKADKAAIKGAYRDTVKGGRQEMRAATKAVGQADGEKAIGQARSTYRGNLDEHGAAFRDWQPSNEAAFTVEHSEGHLAHKGK